MDKYSTNPWCVDSKNLDIFSDSQSVKAMAWTDKEVITNPYDIKAFSSFVFALDSTLTNYSINYFSNCLSTD